MAVLSDSQRELNYDTTLTHDGLHVIVITYSTSENQDRSTIQIDASTPMFVNNGTVAVNKCRYSTLCRAVAVDHSGKLAVFNFESNFIKLVLKVSFMYTGKVV